MPWPDIEQQLCGSWPAIRAARERAEAQMERVQDVVTRGEAPIDSEDISVVVFGSLARGEWTAGSDLDWTLLIDGQADHRHALTAHELAKAIDAEQFRGPGTTGVFGNMAFSPSLIHQIGGDDDTNQNTTRRLLLLLESRPVNRTDAYDRVIKAILSRYLHDYRRFRIGIPHFLLNDLQRYWRTMCVDYAFKNRERSGSRWALRVIKLRFSRKLIFAAGLLTCLQCDATLLPEEDNRRINAAGVDAMVEYLRQHACRPPLEILAQGLGRFGRPGTAAKILDAYDEFLDRINDPHVRKTLEDLPPREEDNAVLKQLKDVGKRFQDGLVALFFDDSPALGKLVRSFGLF
jgi:predicted nucleotidyltransferase